MKTVFVDLAGHRLLLDPAGILVWPEEGLLAVADLHVGKGHSFARRGQFLPPYDTHVTLARLELAIDRHRPRLVISLGDAFHDSHALGGLDPLARERLARLVARQDWLWIAGNHDPDPPAGLGGVAMDEFSLGCITFRHAPLGLGCEIAGHLHPKARVIANRRSLRVSCFVGDVHRLVMPAFGSFTGGLNVLDPVIAGLFPGGFSTYLLGEHRVHAMPAARLEPDRSIPS